jgi:hypothetical protein
VNPCGETLSAENNGGRIVDSSTPLLSHTFKFPTGSLDAKLDVMAGDWPSDKNLGQSMEKESRKCVKKIGLRVYLGICVCTEGTDSCDGAKGSGILELDSMRSPAYGYCDSFNRDGDRSIVLHAHSRPPLSDSLPFKEIDISNLAVEKNISVFERRCHRRNSLRLCKSAFNKHFHFCRFHKLCHIN